MITHEFQPHKYITLEERERARERGGEGAPVVVGWWPHLAPNPPLSIYISDPPLAHRDRVRIFDETRSRRSIHHGFFFGVLQIFTRGRESRRRLRPRLPSALRSPPPVLRRRPDLHPASDFPSPAKAR
ncbi:unnamed protein product [Musa banksii]